MSLACGIIGLPNVGKSTLFNSITQRSLAKISNYPFSTIQPHISVVAVPDEKLKTLAEVTGTDDITPTTVKFFDIAGLARGASRGEGLGNQFLDYIRKVNLLIHVVRCFSDANVSHLNGSLNAVRDIETVNLELVLADLVLVEARLQKVRQMLKERKKEVEKEEELLMEIKSTLEEGRSPRQIKEENPELYSLSVILNLLSAKPVLYLANVNESEDEKANDHREGVRRIASEEGAMAIFLPAKLEAELAELSAEEAGRWRKEMGLSSRGLDELIRASYSLLNLITFYTATAGKVRAWAIPMGTVAVVAAGKVHSDMEANFMRAEVISFANLVESGSTVAARDNGLLRIEGPQYVVQDEDVIHFRFGKPR
ncbi:redox-regulated ATPase YchF [candidate division NPL-UPA2 bacterium Unc8]|uniref:Ribosome-binding ATPase YchF n=1 Tax=candidate division NPL-UPA2 bacterium Unc8 TaxID=1980939 RepID=A0A399G0V7_UNCN2|nr:Ribosome-binding ATPase YchF [Bacillota bacterium]MBT9147670.1 Ribosome-binding ATPase YchF [Bacillota bacterium]RII01013.1 MAG: redox-regulated ATPase YchF [candidate division NPL-UPA2 bacterium Unc8]